MDKQVWKNSVLIVSALIIVILVVVGALMPEAFGDVAGRLFEWTTRLFGWFYLLAVLMIILFLAGLAISKYGTIRLGGEDERPEFSFFSWIGMLFSAGFGVGLVFWGVAEPASHFFSTPFRGTEPLTEEAARIAMGYSFFHWGVSQWAIFAIVGLAIGFMQFRKKKDGRVSTALTPVLGDRPAVRSAIDNLAVVATVMGIATSIGLGIMQMSGGLDAVFRTGQSFVVQTILIAAVFILYMLSSTSGLDKGMKYLSTLNLALALAALLFILVTGPTVFIMESFTLAIGDYVTNFVQYSLRLQPYVGGTWIRDWTIFYWAWAIAWSPFVGGFVARVSRGRTIREFIIAVMVIPPAIACLWIAAFGGTALWKDLNEGAGIAAAVDADLTSALFVLYEHLPFTTILSVGSILLILTFLVTSADSATFILASMTSYGSMDPPKYAKYVWGVLMSAIAGVLLYAGGLEALQTASLVAALPFTVVLLLMVAAIVRLLRHEPLPIRKADLRRFRRLEEASSKASRKQDKGKGN